MSQPKPELSRPLAIDALGSTPVVRSIRAEPAELEALTRRLSLVALNSLEATVTVTRQSGGRLIAVSGTFKAEPVQVCVVTLEPFANPVEDQFEIRFTTDPVATSAEVVIDPDNLDEPEPLEGGVLDLGELVTQFFSLALDPHPRKPGVVFDNPAADDDAEEGARNPFAVLGALKTRR